MAIAYQPGKIINDKYRITDILGKGGVAITYSAVNLGTESQVAIKVISLKQLSDWKAIELFQREAEVLAKLNHPAIPKYIDYFTLETETDQAFYLVQQQAPGKSLAQLVANGWHSSEQEVKNIAQQILEILIYLHSLDPPVIHRDIKPNNLIRSEEGTIYLVDFGAVQNTYYDTLMQGSTVVGTYTAIDKNTNQQVALKALSLTGLEDWKKIELFEREAKILQQLNHPAIPKYLDYFQVETESDIFFFIVQQLAPGKSLAHLRSQGWQPDEIIIKNIAEQILEILVYLQQLTPPVIHRDLKPQNIIYQPNTGKLFLVDFGAVQDTYHHTVMGSTVVGTYGYMAPEQYRGGAVLSTDLYSLGCTLLFLLTGESPAELPQKNLKIDFRNHVNIRGYFANWIDKLIEPNIKKRFPQAEAALVVLQEKKSFEDYHNKLIFKPKYSSIKITKDQKKIIINIPPTYQRKYFDKSFYLWLPWTILSILNRFAIFSAIAFFGKILLFNWFFMVVFSYIKNFSLILQYLLLILSIFYFKSIPSFSILLFFIDTILELFSNYNWVRPLFFTTRITLFARSPDSSKSKDLGVMRKMLIEKKVINIWHREAIKYLSQNASLPNSFLTSQEKEWLHSEIWGDEVS